MINNQTAQWLAFSLETTSHRQIYALAIEIGKVGSPASPEMRKAARKVVRSLRDVIELPIAKASVLANADRNFAVLVTILREADADVPPLLAA